jgi:hypothetical protein
MVIRSIRMLSSPAGVIEQAAWGVDGQPAGVYVDDWNDRGDERHQHLLAGGPADGEKIVSGQVDDVGDRPDDLAICRGDDLEPNQLMIVELVRIGEPFALVDVGEQDRPPQRSRAHPISHASEPNKKSIMMPARAGHREGPPAGRIGRQDRARREPVVRAVGARVDEHLPAHPMRASDPPHDELHRRTYRSA